MYAALEKHSEVARLLVEQGADVNEKMVDGTTALLRAANNDTELVRLFLAHGANPNAHWKDGTTALRTASQNPEIVSMLKQSGARK